MIRRSALAVVVMTAVALAAQPAGLRNGGFEEGEAGGVPAGWELGENSGPAGYRAALSSDGPKSGAHAAMLVRDREAKAPGSGILRQKLDGLVFRDRRVTLRASVRVAQGSRAFLWVSADRASGLAGASSASDTPITSSSWAEYRVDANVESDAVTLFVGLQLQGDGPAWLDDVSVGSVALKVRPPAAPRAFEGRGLDNAAAFTRLLGYVRYFHPSDEAAAADWDLFAIEGISDIETAAAPDALARLLQERFRPVAPTVRVFAGTPPPLPADLKQSSAARRAVMWKHHGVGIRQGPQTPYKSERWTADLVDGRLADGMADPASPLVVDLGGGVKAAVPLALWSDGTGTLPRRAPTLPSEPAGPIATSAADRATRLADVALAWNVFQHFYPYFDVVPADWPAALRQALTSAATDDERSFGTTLQALVAGLHDGHGRVSATVDAPAILPLRWDWIEGKLVVTEVAAGETAVRRGDVVEAIGGRPAAAVIAERERLISGATPQWRRYRALNELRVGPAGEVTLTLAADGAPREVRVQRTTTGAAVSEPRPGAIAEIGPGIMYLDPARVSDTEFKTALPRLSQARGVIFEMRGYPRLSPVFLQHLTGTPVESAQWLVPVVTRPDREGWTYDTRGRWTLPPLAPRLAGRIAFVTDGSAISYAESCMGIVEHYKLGEIVGGPTAGTNGNVNPFTLPGGFTISWTGMKVLKHDGSRHHGVGIQPTVPVARTIAGVRAGRDEVLERAIEVVSR